MFDLFKVTLAAVSSRAKLVLLQLRGAGPEGDDGECESIDDATFLQQLGVAARPIVSQTLRALVLRFGNDDYAFKVWDKAKQPTSLTAGETQVFACGNTGVKVRCLPDGSVEIQSSGAPIKLMGNAATADRPVAHEGSVTTGHNHTVTFALTAGPYPVSGTITVANNTDTIATGAGSANVLVPNT